MDGLKRRPWWAVAMAGGFGAVLAVLFALGLVHGPAAEAQTPVRTSGISAPQSEQEWRTHIDAKLSEMGERLARIEGRLDRGR